MVMVFSIVTAVQEKLNDLMEEVVKHKKEEAERVKKEKDEADQVL